MLTLDKTCGEIEAPLALEGDAIELVFPTGLLGFESSKRFRLISPPDLAPYQWLEGLDDLHLSFLVLPSVHIPNNYRVDLSDEDAESVGLRDAADAVLLNIAVCHKDGAVTVNLKGPIVYHRQTLAARQVVPNNACDLPLSHPLD
ncbi:MAG: hypothetical protein EXS29_07675 [Pedosphaera sp.]|nr:hypothetical protein [Pedosphaera sp.]MST01173.1 hypothetical protein [Pedosphaera sp.]